MTLCDIIQTGDWKGEKHVPVIEVPEQVAAGQFFDVLLSVGKEIAHPNTVEHQIRWIRLFFVPKGSKIPYEVGALTFDVHGESAKGANEGPAHCDSQGMLRVKLNNSGTFFALSYCNIHGLWSSEKEIIVEG